MKLDLTKDEWEFLRMVINWLNGKLNYKNIPPPWIGIKSFDKLVEKLNKEWINEEEEMLKFTMGFAYRPKEERTKLQKLKDLGLLGAIKDEKI